MKKTKRFILKQGIQVENATVKHNATAVARRGT
jgi:hypothetical protein